MKKILVVYMCSFLGVSMASAQVKLNVSGYISGLPDTTKIYINSLFSGLAIDSTMPSNGKFALDLDLPDRDGYLLQLGNDRTNEFASATLYLQEGKMNITGKGPYLKDAVYSGSDFAKDFNDFKNKMNTDPVVKTMYPLMKKYQVAYAKNDTVAMKKMVLEFGRIDSTMVDIGKEWVKGHLNSPVSSFVLFLYVRRDNNLPEVRNLLNKLPSAAKNNAPAKSLQMFMDALDMLAIGKPAPLFTQNDTMNLPVSLASFKGKYVLIDFWASWCKPCREENPKVVQAFTRFNKKNYTVLSVSLDQPGAKELWIKAIHDDGLTWTHVSDLKSWDNAVAKQYGIQSIPANFLVNPEGIIVAKDLRGDELDKKLEELLGATGR